MNGQASCLTNRFAALITFVVDIRFLIFFFLCRTGLVETFLWRGNFPDKTNEYNQNALIRTKQNSHTYSHSHT